MDGEPLHPLPLPEQHRRPRPRVPDRRRQAARRAVPTPPARARPANFAEWIQATMGAGIAKHFMVPYNFKVWATPAELMNYVWIGERVTVVDVEQLLRNVLMEKPEKQWGPNSTTYPLRGGTGSSTRGCGATSSTARAEHARRRRRPRRQGRHHADGRAGTTTSCCRRCRTTSSSGPRAPRTPSARGGDLVWSGSHIVGIGVDRPSTPRRTGSTSPSRRPLLPGHLPVELLPLPDRRARPVQPAHRDVDVPVQAGGRGDDRRPGRRRARHHRPAGGRRPGADRGALAVLPGDELPGAVGGARRGARHDPAVAALAARSGPAGGSAAGSTRSATWTTRRCRAWSSWTTC